LLGGGEATVTVRGDGVGGRNTEFALAGAIALAEAGPREWTIASLATDGDDGPTGAAGAVADAATVARARAAGVDPADALARNDSLRVFEAAGGVARSGPTGTNVNDLYLAVRCR
jgi:hydroxypyruvate reductase